MRKPLIAVLTGALLITLAVSVPSTAHAAPAPIGPGPNTYTYLIDPEDPDNPIRWQPCDPVTWKLAPGRATKKERRLLTAAVATVAKATNLTFTYQGDTSAPIADYDQARDIAEAEGVDAVIAFLEPSDLNGLSGWTAGLGGFRTSGGYATRGAVVLDQKDVRRMSSREQTSLYLHELGHMVGLGHVRGDHIMATAGLDRHQFSKADLAGLYTLGRHGNDCVGGTDTAPGPVTNVQAIAQPDGSILVTWTPTGGWAATYDVMLWERGSSGGSGFGRRTTTPSYVITAEDLEDVNEGNTLSIEITGVNDIGEGTPVTIPIR